MPQTKCAMAHCDNNSYAIHFAVDGETVHVVNARYCLECVREKFDQALIDSLFSGTLDPYIQEWGRTYSVNLKQAYYKQQKLGIEDKHVPMKDAIPDNPKEHFYIGV